MYDYLIVGSGLSGATFPRTVVTREYPVPFSAGSGSAAAPYYPVATPHNAAIAAALASYAKLSNSKSSNSKLEL